MKVYFKSKLIAQHKRLRTGIWETERAQMPENHREHERWTPKRFGIWAKEEGEVFIMSLQHTLSRLRGLRLGAMAGALEHQCEQPYTYDELGFTERVGLLVQRECIERENRKHKRLVRDARFRLSAHLSDIDYTHSRNFSNSQVAELWDREGKQSSHNWALRKREDVDSLRSGT